jgi:ethanolamine utilization protein EutA (predicted chaperonin)
MSNPELEIKEEVKETTAAKKAKAEDAKLEKLTKDFETLIKMYGELQGENQELKKQVKTKTVDLEEEVFIHSYSVAPVILKDRSGNIRISFNYQDEIPVLLKDIKEIFRSDPTKWKRVFETGVLSFVDESYYNLLKISRRFSLQEPNLIDLLITNHHVGKIEETIKKVTNNNADQQTLHCFWFRVVDLYDTGSLRNMSHEVLKFLEEYFNASIRQSVESLKSIKSITF